MTLNNNLLSCLTHVRKTFFFYVFNKNSYRSFEFLHNLCSEINFLHQEHGEASSNLEGYLNNPINAYRLIKRLYTDWPTFEESVMADVTRTSR